MIAFVKSIDKGWVGNVKEGFCYDLNDNEKVNGCYRSLTQFLPFMASFYLKVAQENLLLFNNKINTFHVALGGDGAPFGKTTLPVHYPLGQYPVGGSLEMLHFFLM